MFNQAYLKDGRSSIGILKKSSLENPITFFASSGISKSILGVQYE